MEVYGWVWVIFVALVVGLLLTGLGFSILRRVRLARIQAMFRRFNQRGQDVAVISDWIAEGRSAGRFLEVLEYLEKIEDDALALKVVDRVGGEGFCERHVRACLMRLYKRTERREDALDLAKKMLAADPRDDSILDLYLDVHLTFGAHRDVSDLIVSRIEKRFKGTTFPRHYARLLAARGRAEEAVTIMENVVEREQTLFRNTLGQPQKSLIGAQLDESIRYLESFRQARSQRRGASPDPPDKKS